MMFSMETAIFMVVAMGPSYVILIVVRIHRSHTYGSIGQAYMTLNRGRPYVHAGFEGGVLNDRTTWQLML